MRPIAFMACVFLVGCGSDSGPATPAAPTPAPAPASPTVTAVLVSGPGCTDGGGCPGTAGTTLQLSATARLSDGSTRSVTTQVAWSSTNTSVATVAADGLVRLINAGEADILAAYQGQLGGQTVRAVPAGPRSSFGAGRYLVGREIVPGRYFADPVSGCYWERLRGLGGSTGDIIANDFVGYNAGQIIVDIAPGDLAFNTDAECGTWNQSPRRGLAANITPGMWLVGSQVSPGVYSANVASGCYWERLRSFSGTLDAIIANDFIGSASRQLVEIRSGDIGFNNDGDCGDWTRVPGLIAPTDASGSSGFDDSIWLNRAQRRGRLGLPD